MMNISTPRSRRSGFTLIEVAIALAIFVFGALAIIQIFPPALGVIRNNESRVAATQLGETMLARAVGKPDSVPDAIYDGTSSIWNDVVTVHGTSTGKGIAVIGTPSKNNSLPASPLPNDFEDSALGHFRYVKGERHVVLNGDGTPYVLLNFPCIPGTVNIYEEDTVEGVQIDDDGNLDFTYARRASDGTSFSDTTATKNRPLSAFRSDGFTTYYASYRWRYDPSDTVREPDVVRVMGVVDEPLLIPEDSTWDGNDSGKVVQGLVASSNHIIPGGVTVRFVRRVGYATVPIDDAVRGYINFDDGYTFQNNGTTALTPITGRKYSFDYTVSDWRNLVDDSAPAQSGRVTLPLQNLDNAVTVNGLLTTVGGVIVPGKVSPAIDYKKGEATYSTGGVTAPRARTVYRTLDGWAQQLSVAPKSYIPFYSARPTESPRERWREYFWSPAYNPDTLYFPASEAGKTIAVTYEYLVGSNWRTVTNAVMTIDGVKQRATTINDLLTPFRPTGAYAEVKIPDPTGAAISVNATAILSVQGLSVQARTAWQNADRYNQVIVPAYRTLLQ